MMRSSWVCTNTNRECASELDAQVCVLRLGASLDGGRLEAGSRPNISAGASPKLILLEWGSFVIGIVP
jgi:hypothetical protein